MFELFGHDASTRSVGIFLEEAALDYVVSPGPNPQRSFALVHLDKAHGPEGRKWIGYRQEALLYLAGLTGRFIPQDQAAAERDLRYGVQLREDPRDGDRHSGRALDWSVTQLERRLGETPFAAGDYSIADMVLYPLLASEQLPADELPNTKRWLATLAGRPALSRAMRSLG